MGFARHLKLSYSLHTPMLEASIYWVPVWQALSEAQKKYSNEKQFPFLPDPSYII